MKSKFDTGTWYFGDCFDGMAELEPHSVDFILCDLPYGVVNWNKPYEWDEILPFDKMWEAYWRILKPKGAICLFGNDPFTTHLKHSQMQYFKYDYIWLKSNVSGFVSAKLKPMKKFEIVSVFSQGTTSPGRPNNMPYYPQGLVRIDKKVKNSAKPRMGYVPHKGAVKEYVQEFTNYPNDILEYPMDKNRFHPTQKPVALFEHLIKTYSKEGETVLDNTAGSGTTAIAAMNTKRKWICMEKNSEYSMKAIARIGEKTLQMEQQIGFVD